MDAGSLNDSCGRGDALSHCCGLVVAFACGRARGMDALTTERYAGKRPARHFKAFEACQTAALNAYKKPLLRPGGCLEPLLWPCGGFLPAGVPEAWTP